MKTKNKPKKISRFISPKPNTLVNQVVTSSLQIRFGVALEVHERRRIASVTVRRLLTLQ